MKKVLFGLVALSSLALAQGTNLYFRTGVDVSERYESIYNISEEENDSTGFELAVELTRTIGKDFELGVGVAYQNHQAPKGRNLIEPVEEDTVYRTKFDFDDLKSIPVYLTGKFNVPTESNLKPYLKMDLGYSFNFGMDNIVLHNDDTISGSRPNNQEDIILYSDVNDGIYFGVGFGVEYNNFVADLMYKINNAELKYEDADGGLGKKDIDYSRVTLSFGYKFNF